MQKKLKTTKKSLVHIWQEAPELILMKLPFMKDEIRISDKAAQTMLSDLLQIYPQDHRRLDPMEQVNSW